MKQLIGALIPTRQDAALMMRRLSFPESSLSFFPALGDAALRSLMSEDRLALILVRLHK